MKKLQQLFLATVLAASPAASSSTIDKTAYFEANPSLGGDVKILKSSKFVVGKESFTQFDVYASESGKYFVNFWMLPPQLTDGTFCSYRLIVNGVEQSAKITPAKTGWQSIHLDDNAKISLNNGNNTIAIVGVVPEIPAVEHVTMSKFPTEFNLASDYDKYIQDIVLNQGNGVNELSLGGEVGGGTIDLPIVDVPYVPFDYEFSENVDIKYTYQGLFYFNEGETITVKSTAKNGFTHVINLYSLSAPEKYSWYDGTNANISVVAPISGVYGLMARSSKVDADGFCDLTVNDRYKFVNLPLSMSRILVAQSTDQMYNSFTTNSDSCWFP